MGVKGLVDSKNGVIDIPKIFIRPPEEFAEELNRLTDLQVPAIDLHALKETAMNGRSPASSGGVGILPHGKSWGARKRVDRIKCWKGYDCFMSKMLR